MKVPRLIRLVPILLLVLAPLRAGESDPDHYTYKVVRTYPHDRGAFTEGLMYLDGVMYESTGITGKSSLRKVELETGKVLQQVDLAPEYFGEGMTVLHGKIYQLTWKHHLGFVYDLATFKQLGKFRYTGEGWGLTTDGQSLIMSDGSNVIRFIDPNSFAVTRTIAVALRGDPLDQLNELEYVDGKILANVWRTPSIVSINPKDGTIDKVIDLMGILPIDERTPATDVLNGIAYDPEHHRLFVTGKYWPKLFEITVEAVTDSQGMVHESALGRVHDLGPSRPPRLVIR